MIPMDVKTLMVLLEARVIDQREQSIYSPYEYVNYGSSIESIRHPRQSRTVATIEVPVERLENVCRAFWDLDETKQRLSDAENQIQSMTVSARLEAHLREQHPGLKEAYEKYQTLLKLVT